MLVRGYLWTERVSFFGCSDYRWGECKVNMKIIFWICIAVVAVFLLCVLLAICYCWCCCCKRSKSFDSINNVEYSEMAADKPYASHAAKKREDLYEKYGTPEERAAKRREEKISTSIF
eukprot:TRINITY_DN584_c0_g1_i1.p1 TRINITY_DN584_c0_g1~~TRINITY_DN584_c0_g1_i1.p1  ORF type:complete len:118 (+),score=2.06 TRINITY_DN584_c0_g1_i1:257-610(+)